MTDTVETPTQDDPSIVGHMTPEETQEVQRIQMSAKSLLSQIGETEVRICRMKKEKDALIEALEAHEAALRATLLKVEERFGFKEGEVWQALPDGSVRKLNL